MRRRRTIAIPQSQASWSFALPALPGSLSAMPAAPVSPTTINVTSTRVITTAVSDTIFNVTGSVATAVQINGGGSLTRCEIRCNGLVSYAGVASPDGIKGVCTDVKVVDTNGTCGYGFIKCSFGGNCYATRCTIGFYITGTGITLPAGATLRAYDNNNFGFLMQELYSSTFSGLMYADYTGGTAGGGSATGWEIWQNCTDCDFAFVYSTRHAGYSAAINAANEIAANTQRIRVRALYGDGAGHVGDSDPGLTITGGVNDVTIDQLFIKNHTMGVTIGEYDYVSQIRRQSTVHIGTCDLLDHDYTGLRMEHTDGVTVDHMRLTNCGTIDPTNICKGALSIGRATAHYISPESYIETNCTGVNCPDVQILRGAGTKLPQYAVLVTASSRPAAGGSVTGTVEASSYSIAKVNNLAGGNFPVNVP